MQEPLNLELNYPVMVWTFYSNGALLVAMETTVCIRSCLNLKKIYFWCHTFIFHIINLETNMFILKINFGQKVP